MKKILILSWITDDYIDILNAKNLQNSIKYFHSDVEFKIFNTADTIHIKGKYNGITNMWMKPAISLEYIDSYDMIVLLDGDIIITGDLTDILTSVEDIICVRNMNSQGKAGAHFWGNHITLDKKIINSVDFLNAGLVASNSKKFWIDWHTTNEYYRKYNMHGMGDEQGTLNHVFYNGEFSTKIMDGPGIKASYGLTNAWGTGNNHWESWSSIFVREDKLYIPDPIEGEIEVKVLHQAGGQLAHDLNLKHHGFRNWLKTIVSEDVNQYIDKITS